MDKRWMQKGRCDRDYFRGCDAFLDFAWSHRTPDLGENIFCPCVRCNNVNSFSRNLVRKHILDYGITRSYTRWTKHGELDEVNNIHEEVTNVIDGGDMHGMLQDSFPQSRFFAGNGEVLGSSQHDRVADEPNEDAQKFYKLLKEAETPLYHGCTTASKLSFLVSMLHLKCSNGLSNKGFDDHLALLRCTYPESSIPKNYYEAKKQLRDLGMECIKIDACRNDCMLYWKGIDREKDQCDACGESRWISGTCQSVKEVSSGKQNIKRKSCSVLRYFPLKPRLQRLYMSSKTAKEMRWHAEDRTKDGVLRHPADSKAWETLDTKHQAFGSEPRNVRLGLASDGFNPFGVMSTSHSTWPVFVVPYNLPPWMCMKQPYFILSLLIAGPKGPGNNIDVYLRPLVEELKELWTYGIETYDAYSKQNFQMHAALLWTINDFPAYANLSGWSTKGYLACPCCHKDTSSKRLQNGKKCVYMGHRRFLPIRHRFRDNKSSFNGRQEKNSAPKPLTGDDVLRQLRGYHQITFGKEEHAKCGEKRRREDNALPHNWKKISIFFELPYWKDLLLRHNLDVMHTEKNRNTQNSGVCVNVETSITDSVDYYGRLDEVVVLHYRDGNQVVLFKCHWWDISESRKKQRDAFGFISLNFTRTIYRNEPFMLAKQAHQVFYLQDNKDKNRRIVLKMQARDLYSMGTMEVELIQDSSHADNHAISASETVQDFGSWTRNEIEGEEVIRGTGDSDEDDDSDSDHSDYLSDCERDDLV